MLFRLFLCLAALGYHCNAGPTISPPHTLLPRDASTDCQNVTQGLNASCWDLVPPKMGMQAWLNTWNQTTTTCHPGEMWANCFMRLAGLPSNVSKPIRCDLIGEDVCPTPDADVFAQVTAPVGYGIASIWALQQYMTTVYQYVTGDEEGVPLVKNEFLGQSVPRSVKPILTDILNGFGDPVAGNLTKQITNSTAIGQPTFIIPTEALAPQIVGQTVGYLLQWMMKEWADGGFTALAVEGNLIAVLADSE